MVAEGKRGRLEPREPEHPPPGVGISTSEREREREKERERESKVEASGTWKKEDKARIEPLASLDGALRL